MPDREGCCWAGRCGCEPFELWTEIGRSIEGETEVESGREDVAEPGTAGADQASVKTMKERESAKLVEGEEEELRRTLQSWPLRHARLSSRDMDVPSSTVLPDVVLRSGENLLRRELRRVGEEFLIVKDREALGGNLRERVRDKSRVRKEEKRERRRTSQKSSCNSSSSCTTLAAEKLSSLAGSFPLAYKMFGEMTVARFCKSILDPVSSSTCEKDATHLRKTKRTSIVSR